MSTEARLEREREFHNTRFEEDGRGAQLKYYWAIERGARAFRQRVETLSEGSDIFELGCAMGDNVFAIQSPFKSATGLDISDYAVAHANELAASRNWNNTRFLVGNAEATSLESDSFDLVYGSGIIHHLDIMRSISEVKRILRPGGRAVFWEPLGHNPFINGYRALTPSARTADEHPLVRKDMDLISEIFPRGDYSFYGLTTLALVPIRGLQSSSAIRRVGESLDSVLFSLPGVKWLAWYVMIELVA